MFEKLADNWAPKKHKMITEFAKKSPETTKKRLKTNLAQIITLTWPR